MQPPANVGRASIFNTASIRNTRCVRVVPDVDERKGVSLSAKVRDILLTMSLIVQVSATTPDEEEMAAFALASRSEDAVKNALGPHQEGYGWGGTSYRTLDPSAMNCGRCAVCGAWTTDRERPEPIGGLQNGARIDARLLCDEHLPEGHRWRF